MCMSVFRLNITAMKSATSTRENTNARFSMIAGVEERSSRPNVGASDEATSISGIHSLLSLTGVEPRSVQLALGMKAREDNDQSLQLLQSVVFGCRLCRPNVYTIWWARKWLEPKWQSLFVCVALGLDQELGRKNTKPGRVASYHAFFFAIPRSRTNAVRISSRPRECCSHVLQPRPEVSGSLSDHVAKKTLVAESKHTLSETCNHTNNCHLRSGCERTFQMLDNDLVDKVRSLFHSH